MEQRNKTKTKKKSVYHNTVGVIAQLQPKTIWLNKQRMQASQTNSTNKAVKMSRIPRKQHSISPDAAHGPANM